VRVEVQHPRHIQHEAGCDQKPVLMSIERGYAFKDNILLCDIFARHLVHLRSTKYRKTWGGGLFLISVTDS